VKLSDEIALERCDKLFAMAREQFAKNKPRSKRYVEIARKLAMRHRLPLGSKSYCKKCGIIFIPGVTLKVRADSKAKAVVYVCCECGAKKKFGYSKEKAKRKKVASSRT